MALLWDIAVGQLLARKRQAISIVAAVVIGVTLLIVTLSLFGGLLDSFTEKILDVTPHLTLKAESVDGGRGDILIDGAGGARAAVELEKTVEHEDRLRLRNVMTTLRLIERTFGERLSAASPYLATQALATYGTNEITLPVNGVLPEREAGISDLSRYMKSGSVGRLEGTRDGMLIGEKVAADLGVDFGDRVQLVSLSGEVIQVRVVGVYRLGVEATDRSAFVNLRLAQALDNALPGEATAIGFQLRDVAEAQILARQIEKLTGREAETWQETNAGIISIFQFLRILFFVVVGFVIIICGFGVANILITTVLEKGRDIAVMKSFGVSSGQITAIYLLQGLIIAVLGALLGSALGAIGIELMGMIPRGETAGVAPIESKTLQMSWSPWYFAIAIVSTLVVSMIAAFAPARSAARVIPAEVLRGER